jgi:hypothetical protein
MRSNGWPDTEEPDASGLLAEKNDYGATTGEQTVPQKLLAAHRVCRKHLLQAGNDDPPPKDDPMAGR